MWIESMNLTLLGRPPGAQAAVHDDADELSRRRPRASPRARPPAPRQPRRARRSRRPPASGCLQAQLAATDRATARRRRIRTVITGPAGNANTAAAAVTLPAGIAVNLDALGRARARSPQQAAGPCPETAARRPRRRALAAAAAADRAGVPRRSCRASRCPGVRVDLSGVV